MNYFIKRGCRFIDIEIGVIRSLGENGIKPIYIAIRHRVALGVKSKYVSKVHQVASVEEGYKVLMENYGKVYKIGEKAFVLFSDDKSVGYFVLHYDGVKEKFITYNAMGTQRRIMEFMDKKNILDLVKKHGLNVLELVVVNKGEIPKGLQRILIQRLIITKFLEDLLQWLSLSTMQRESNLG